MRSPKFSLLYFLVIFTIISLLIGLWARSERIRVAERADFERRLSNEVDKTRSYIFESGCRKILSDWGSELAVSANTKVFEGVTCPDDNSMNFQWVRYVQVSGEKELDLGFLKSSFLQSSVQPTLNLLEELGATGIRGSIDMSLTSRPEMRKSVRHVVTITFVPNSDE